MRTSGISRQAGALALCVAMLGTMAAGQDAAEGGLLYERHCATCHGVSGEGRGPMAGVLVIQPTDLTTLAARGRCFPGLAGDPAD